MAFSYWSHPFVKSFIIRRLNTSTFCVAGKEKVERRSYRIVWSDYTPQQQQTVVLLVVVVMEKDETRIVKKW